MLYSIVSIDTENSLKKRLAVRDKHIERLLILKNQGRLILAGPNPKIDTTEPAQAGFSGSIVIAEFDCWEDAQTWADADPYLQAGVYQNTVVKPFKKVLP